MFTLNETLSQTVLNSFNNSEIIIPLILSTMVTIIATWLIFHQNFIIEILRTDSYRPEPLKSLFNFAVSVGFATLISIVITWGIFKLFRIVEYLLLNGIEATVEVSGGILDLIVENFVVVLIMIFAYLILTKKKSESQ